MVNDPMEMIRIVMEGLDALGVEYAIIGGISIPLHIEPNSPVRPRFTKDVDCIVNVDNYVDFAAFEEKLRHHGFENDPGTVICRWIYREIAVDIIPKDPTSLGFPKSDFFSTALDNMEFREKKGLKIPVIPTSFQLALKIEAFKDRGKDDWMVSQDLEDIITIIDGNKSVVEQIRTVHKDGPWKFVRDWCYAAGREKFEDWAASNIRDDERGRYIVNEIFNAICIRCGEPIETDFESEYKNFCDYCSN